MPLETSSGSTCKKAETFASGCRAFSAPQTFALLETTVRLLVLRPYEISAIKSLPVKLACLCRDYSRVVRNRWPFPVCRLPRAYKCARARAMHTRTYIPSPCIRSCMRCMHYTQSDRAHRYIPHARDAIRRRGKWLRLNSMHRGPRRYYNSITRYVTFRTAAIAGL